MASSNAPQVAPESKAVVETVYSPIHASEPIIWKFFIERGYTPEQTAGIMGNLWQESRFNTAMQDGGLGVAQWLGGRAYILTQRAHYLSLEVQIDYIDWELNNTEGGAGALFRTAKTVEQATGYFMSSYERCNPTYCNRESRIEHANGFYERNR